MSLTSAQTQRRRILVLDDERTTGYQLNGVIGLPARLGGYGQHTESMTRLGYSRGLPQQFAPTRGLP